MTKIEMFEAIDRCLFWKEKKILVVGDLHLGYEDFLAEKGWSFPKTQLEDTIEGLKKIFEESGKLKEIVLLGDVKHYFAGVLNGEFSDFKKVIDLISENLLSSGKIVITKGNHDSILEPLISRWGYENVKIVEYYSVEGVLFFHGNSKGWNNLEIYDKKNKLLVVGHFHPAVKIREDSKTETFKCFLLGKLNKKQTIVLPSFFGLVEGTDVLSGRFEEDFSNFEVYAVADKVYDFGKVKDLE